MQGGSVFADFAVDEHGCLYILRISYDGYGCCQPEEKSDTWHMGKDESKQLIALIESNNLGGPAAGSILRDYFQRHQDKLWPEALEEHGLI